MKYIKDFLLMFQFFTRIPINMSLPCESKNFRDGSAFFSLMGLIIGLIQLGVYELMARFLPVNVTAAFIIVTAILVTGGLHIDGLGDTCDGFFALKGSDKIIEIMKDSRIGTFACVAIVLDLLVKFSAYGEVLAKGSPMLIVLAPMYGRFSISMLAAMAKPAKPNGSGNLFIRNTGMVQICFNILTTVGVSLWLAGIKSTAILVAGAMIVTLLFNKFCVHKMNGITGDSFGANNELVEILTLVILCAII